MSEKELREENKRLREILQQVEKWASCELDEAYRRHLNSYTHGECGYEEAQEQVLDILTAPDGVSSVDRSTITRQC